jgi:hypothetical protein
MTKEALIKRTIHTLSGLPADKIREISDFAELLSQKYEEEILSEGIQKLVSESKSFKFLEEEEDLYSVKDLKKKYNEKG